MSEPLLRVKDLVKNYPVKRGLTSGAAEYVHAVDRVSFKIEAGETLGLASASASPAPLPCRRS